MSSLRPYHWERLCSCISEVRLPGQSIVALVLYFVNCAKMCPRKGRTVPNSDRLLGGHPSKSRYSKDLQDGPRIMGLRNGPKQD